jgi:hypothetical protein
MTPFQAIRATIYMLLAKAREPIGDRELIPAPSGVRHQRSRAERSAQIHVRPAQMGRRQSDSPFHRTSSLQGIWSAVIEWVSGRHTGTNV